MANPAVGISERDVMMMVLVELRVMNRLLVELNTTNQDQILALRADEENAVGYIPPALSRKDS